MFKRLSFQSGPPAAAIITIALSGFAISGGFARTAFAGDVTIVDAKASKATGRTYRFDVTLKHDDTGWKHYADRWDVLDNDGKVLGTRVLYHPHVDEQPFTRSLSISIPDGVSVVKIRARDSKHGWAETMFEIKLAE